MQDPELWQRIAAHEFDARVGSAPFSVKLAREENWSRATTRKVIEEYRRFVYLTQISPAQATPPEMVDRAWHMHLTFTRNYWDEFCPNVLGQPLHHEPCIGDEAMPRYRAQFAETRRLYKQEFGKAPPPYIWGKQRDFGEIIGGVLLIAVGLFFLWQVVMQSGWTMTLTHAVVLGIVLYGLFWLVKGLFGSTGAKRKKSKGGFFSFDGSGGGDGCGGGCGGCGG